LIGRQLLYVCEQQASGRHQSRWWLKRWTLTMDLCMVRWSFTFYSVMK